MKTGSSIGADSLRIALIILCPILAYGADTRVEWDYFPETNAAQIGLAEARDLYRQGTCDHLVDLRVRIPPHTFAVNDEKRLFEEIDAQVVKSHGNAFLVNAHGWLQDIEEGESMWAAFAEIEVMECDIDLLPKLIETNEGDEKVDETVFPIRLSRYLVIADVDVQDEEVTLMLFTLMEGTGAGLAALNDDDRQQRSAELASMAATPIAEWCEQWLSYLSRYPQHNIRMVSEEGQVLWRISERECRKR